MDIDTLYHYCPIDSFKSIIESRSIHLSPFTLSNDSSEGKVIGNLLNIIADEDSLDEDSKSDINKAISIIQSAFQPFGFSLSSEGDLLSQWRGYTDDGQGFSIGFSKKFLEEVIEQESKKTTALTIIEEVTYDVEKQLQIVRPIYDKMKQELLEEKSKNQRMALGAILKDEDIHSDFLGPIRSVLKNLLPLWEHLFSLKLSAFKEEKEWRLIRTSAYKNNSSLIYKSSRNKLLPAIELKLPILNELEAIDTIYLGPKNLTPKELVEQFTSQNSFHDIDIRKSSATYR